MTTHVLPRSSYRPTQWCLNCHAPVPVDLTSCPECGEPMPPVVRITPTATSTSCNCCKREHCDGTLFSCYERNR